MKAVLNKYFLDHPGSVDESYLEHMGQAFYFSARMFIGGFACLIHGIIPSAFEKTGSGTISQLHDRMVVNRRKKWLADDASSTEPV